MKRFVTLTAMLFLVCLTIGTASAQTKTAQSIMIDTTGTASDVALVQTNIYKFNKATAATYYTNVWDGNAPTVSCSGPGCSLGNCNSVPSAPVADDTKVSGNSQGQNDLTGDDKCTFLDGGTLSSASYTQEVSTPKCGSGNQQRTYTYKFTYNITPTTTVGAFTAWDLFKTTGDGETAPVDVVALIAGESVSVSKNLGTKYSFSLLQTDGISVRVSNVCVSVDGGAADCSGTQTYMDRNPTGLTPTLNYSYTANALLCNGTACTSLVNGATAMNILNGIASSDTFPGNDNGGANGQALAAVGLNGITVNLAPGSHTLTISATVKDNNGVLIGNVSVSKQVNVVTPGCGGGNGN
jgi:hypothetical protein